VKYRLIDLHLLLLARVCLYSIFWLAP